MRPRPLIIATAVFATQPVTAGIVAHYQVGQDSERRLVVVEVNDRGDSRADLGNGQVMLLLDGSAYVVATDAEGTYAARAEDAFAASMDNVMISDGRRPAHGPLHSSAMLRPDQPPPPQVRVIRGGAEIVAGRQGTVWRISNPSMPANANAEEFVVSADPELAPLNDILGPRGPTAIDLVNDPNGAAVARWAIYRKGAVLREGRHLRLERVEIRPMPDTFTLAGSVISREALAARQQRTER